MEGPSSLLLMSSLDLVQLVGWEGEERVGIVVLLFVLSSVFRQINKLIINFYLVH